eukprot:10561654-Alexandrium_andersonii.AAC.1
MSSGTDLDSRPRPWLQPQRACPPRGAISAPSYSASRRLNRGRRGRRRRRRRWGDCSGLARLVGLNQVAQSHIQARRPDHGGGGAKGPSLGGRP